MRASQKYRLAPHVHACLSGRHIILLDLRQDRYLALDAHDAASLACLIDDWPVVPAGVADMSVVVEAAARMKTQGLLIEPESADVVEPRCRPTQGTDALGARVISAWPEIHSRHVAAMALAAALAWIELKTLPIHWVLHRFSTRRARLESNAGAADIHRSVLIFALLRPYFFRSKDACLFDSLALARFLHLLGIPCRWVFGVQDSPFEAHCWLLHGTTVLNDTLDHVRGYTPILEI